jgi:hypothetical protein
VRCSSCSFDDPEGARFCAGCGTTLAQTRPACGFPVQRRAAALEDYIRHEPLPWADFIIARGRALAVWGCGERDAVAAERLRALREQAASAGLRSAVVAIEAALGVHGRETLVSA